MLHEYIITMNVEITSQLEDVYCPQQTAILIDLTRLPYHSLIRMSNNFLKRRIINTSKTLYYVL